MQTSIGRRSMETKIHTAHPSLLACRHRRESRTPSSPPPHLRQLLLDAAPSDVPHAPLGLQEVVLSSRAKKLFLGRLQPGAGLRRGRRRLVPSGLGLAQGLANRREALPRLLEASFESSRKKQKTNRRGLPAKEGEDFIAVWWFRSITS